MPKALALPELRQLRRTAKCSPWTRSGAANATDLEAFFEGAIHAVVEVLDMGSQCRLAGDEGRPTLVIEDLLPGLAVSALIGVSLPSPQ